MKRNCLVAAQVRISNRIRAFQIYLATTILLIFGNAQAICSQNQNLQGSDASNKLATSPQRIDRKPNIVILLADDLGWQDIGCYGGPVKTPVLDNLASKGIRFTNFYAAAPVCSTSRASLLTGRHHLRTGVYTVIQDHLHDMHLRTGEVTIAEHLKSHGYDTAHFGKWHLGTPFRGRKKPWIDEHGFDYWFATDLNAAPSHRNPANFWRNRKRVGPLEGYACHLVIDEAIDWLDTKRNDSHPFFLNVWFHEPHAPLAAPNEIVSEYGALKDPAAIYSATIDNTDRAIGRLVKQLKKMGELENTIIVYLSDHGSYRHERNGNLRAGKGSLYDGGLRSPAIICWPSKIKKGRIEHSPAGSIDLLPTLCGLIEVAKPQGVKLDGVDLTRLILGNGDGFEREKPLSWHSPLSQPVVAIRDGKYSLVGFRNKEYPKDQKAIESVMEKMRVILEEEIGRPLGRKELWHQCYNSPIKTPEWNRLKSRFVSLNTFQEKWIPMIKSGSGETSRFELYDLSKDPGQKTNLAGKHPTLVNRLKAKVLALNAEILKEAPQWSKSRESTLKIHRLKSTKRSPFDAFVYLNRIPIEMESDESPEDLSGRILGRLANQEGRVQIKLPPGMDRVAYNGFKIALNDGKEIHSGRCFHCHRLPQMHRINAKPVVPTLRNLDIDFKGLQALLSDDSHRDIRLEMTDKASLLEFLKTLRDVPESQFRNLIIKSKVLDTSGDKQ